MSINITMIGFCMVICCNLLAQSPVGAQALNWRIYQQVATETATQGQNMALSPASISRVLAGVYLGAEGATAQEMASVLGWSGLTESALVARYQPLDRAGLRSQGVMAIDREVKLLDGFREQYQSLGGDLLAVDFKYHPQDATKAINERVKAATKGRIPQLLAENAIDERTKMIALHTLMFEAKWRAPFEANQTMLSDFVAADGATYAVNMMKQGISVRYADTQTEQLIELPYATPGLKMVVLLPKEGSAYAAWERGLTWARIEALQQVAQVASVEVYLPKFEQQAHIDLADYMRKMGLNLTFSEAANFTKISQYNTFLSAMLQTVHIAVKEDGTTAAAATAAVMSSKGLHLGRKLFLANRPFLYFVQDEATGELLFVGRYLQPTQAAVSLAAQLSPAEKAPFLHIVSPGETLYQIAKIYQLSVDDLLGINNLEEPVIKVGQKLTIASRYTTKGGRPNANATAPQVVHAYQKPKAQATWTPRGVQQPVAAANPSSATAASPHEHRVQPGETLYSIARRYQLSVNELQVLNCLQDATLSVGAILVIAPQAYTATQEYRVKSGDSLSKIAKAHQLDTSHPQAVKLIQLLNGLDSDMIYVDQKLILPLAERCGTK